MQCSYNYNYYIYKIYPLSSTLFCCYSTGILRRLVKVQILIIVVSNVSIDLLLCFCFLLISLTLVTIKIMFATWFIQSAERFYFSNLTFHGYSDTQCFCFKIQLWSLPVCLQIQWFVSYKNPLSN